MENSILIYGSIVTGVVVLISVIVIIIRRRSKTNNGNNSTVSRNMRNISPMDRMKAKHELELLRRKFNKTSNFGKNGDDPWSKYLNSLSLDERKDEANRLLEIIHRKHKKLINSGIDSNSFVRGGGATGGTAGGEFLSRTGCTDSTATNYNSNALVDDGSCTYVEGCTDSSADNYDTEAVVDDGSCTYLGCTDSSADNYDENATIDDDSCIYSGCTDSTATNYDVNATIDDGSCTYSGCNDATVTADNYDPTAVDTSPTCYYLRYNYDNLSSIMTDDIVSYLNSLNLSTDIDDASREYVGTDLEDADGAGEYVNTAWDSDAMAQQDLSDQSISDLSDAGYGTVAKALADYLWEIDAGNWRDENDNFEYDLGKVWYIPWAAGNDGDGSANRKIYTWAIGMSATDGEPTLNNPKQSSGQWQTKIYVLGRN